MPAQPTTILGTCNVSDGPDFLSQVLQLMAEALALGAAFQPDGTWLMNEGRPPLPAALSDRLRVHRSAIVAILAADAT